MKTLTHILGGRRIAALVCAAALCSTGSNALADEASYKSAMESALAAQKKAKNVGYEWRDTRKLIKKAKSLAKKGEFDKAEKLANRATFQGNAAHAQAQLQEQQWQSFVVR